MKKTGFLIVITVLAMLCTGFVSAANFTSSADDLKAMGLFLGSDKGYDLDRTPTRIEAAVMLVRMIGKEAEAKEKNSPHPFKDVADWASPYVGYLYANKLTTGISADKFGSNEICTDNMFATFTLRALGYTEGVDFIYYDSVPFAKKTGLIPENLTLNPFLRDHCVAIMYNALFQNTKGSAAPLIDKLAAEKAVTQKAADTVKAKAVTLNELNKIITSPEWTKKVNDAMTAEIEMKMAIPMSTQIVSGMSSTIDTTIKMNISVDSRNNKQEYSMNMIVSLFGMPMKTNTYLKDGYIYTEDGTTKTKTKALDADAAYNDMQNQINFMLSDSIAVNMIKDISKVTSGTGTSYKVTFSEDFTSYIFSNMGSMPQIGNITDTDTYSVKSATDVVVTYNINTAGNIESVDTTMKMEINGSIADVKMTMKIKAVGDDVKIIFPDFSGYIEAN